MRDSDTKWFWDQEAEKPTKLPSICLDHRIPFGPGIKRFMREKWQLAHEPKDGVKSLFTPRNERDYLDK